MATLTLTKLWINLMATGAGVSAQSKPDRQREHQSDGGVKTFAGGRQRSIMVKGERSQYGYTIVDVPTASVDVLRSWVGRTVQVRTNRGERYVGAFFDLKILEVRDKLDSYNVSMTIQFVTTDDGV